jgi:hypothetical protein
MAGDQSAGSYFRRAFVRAAAVGAPLSFVGVCVRACLLAHCVCVPYCSTLASQQHNSHDHDHVHVHFFFFFFRRTAVGTFVVRCARTRKTKLSQM